MGKRICVSNQKGGVGKTAVAINVAAALDARGHDVLFVDLDPQGNATEALGIEEHYDDTPPSLFDVLTDSERREAIADLIVKSNEYDVIPSNIDMTAVEPELTLARRSGEQLDLALQHVDYDWIVVDTPPNLGNLLDNALFATRHVLIPALAESTSKRAFELLFDHVSALETDYEIAIRDVGVVVNRIDVRKRQAKEMTEWVRNAFDDVPVYEIRERAAIQYATEAGQSLLTYDSESDQVPVFETIAADLEEEVTAR